jgi:hypothetical protein
VVSTKQYNFNNIWVHCVRTVYSGHVRTERECSADEAEAVRPLPTPPCPCLQEMGRVVVPEEREEREERRGEDREMRKERAGRIREERTGWREKREDREDMRVMRETDR